ncbi:MAG TPA: hypothetical protein PLV57_19200 [Phycisphaerae bacterium]|nr:hypothetical protein [Phycisphaerae bacterium]
MIRTILKMELEGASLKSRHVRVVDPSLMAAATRHFGCWGKAMTAAGIDFEAVTNRRAWTVGRVIKAIHQLDRQGVALNYASVRKVDGGLPQAARKLLGSWDSALHTAGYDPERVRASRCPWTHDEIIDLIRDRAAAGLPVASYNVAPQSAETASRRLFGSWKAALRAAGVPNPSAEFPIWTKVTVIEGILLRQQAGEALHCFAAAHQAPRLYDAARRLFGSWREALDEAGIDPDIVRRRRRPYATADIVAYLKRHAKTAHRAGDHPQSIVKAARRLFGTWHAALNTAGISPR